MDKEIYDILLRIIDKLTIDIEMIYTNLNQLKNIIEYNKIIEEEDINA